MADFLRSSYPRVLITHEEGDSIAWQNKPVNLELVLTYWPTLETLDFSVRAGQRALLGPALAIVFRCVGGTEIAWFYKTELDRDVDLCRLEDCV